MCADSGGPQSRRFDAANYRIFSMVSGVYLEHRDAESLGSSGGHLDPQYLRAAAVCRVQLCDFNFLGSGTQINTFFGARTVSSPFPYRLSSTRCSW